MKPDTPRATSSETSDEQPSTAGMTTKVVKGSLWTLAGQIAPLAFSILTTPFVIRMLGAETYGVYILVGLIPAYLGFADLGMGFASTKYASDAHGHGDAQREADIIFTASSIALATSLPIASLLFFLSTYAVHWLNVPQVHQYSASIGLKFSALTLVVNCLNAIINTPQVARLRMDLTTGINSGFRIVGIIAIPLSLYLFSDIAAVFVLLFGLSVATFICHLFVSRRLLPNLFQGNWSRPEAKSLFKYGLAMLVAGVAGLMLVNGEKLVLTKTTSVEALAYYSVAFTLANMTTMLSTAVTQSLIPAFSQLLAPEQIPILRNLFLRTMRINFLIVLPGLAALLIVAKPFFHVWAGPDFALESSLPFYVLTGGLLFSIMGYIPGSLLLATGHPGVLARLYWLELFPYLFLTFILSMKWGALGAAVAWSIRAAADSIIVSLIAKRLTNVSLAFFPSDVRHLFAMSAVLILPVVISFIFNEYLTVSISVMGVGLLAYVILVWTRLLTLQEKSWLSSRVYPLIGIASKS